MSKHVIVISVDAMVFEDLEYASTLPSFARLIGSGSVIERVRSIYPTLTHPAHASIISGAPAGKTGITSNYIFHPDDPKRSVEWRNRLDEIGCDTLLHAAKRAGLVTASSCWPMTAGGGEVIDYLVPAGLNFYFKDRDHEPMEVFRELGATPSVMDILAEGIEKYGHRDLHPGVDELQAFVSAEIIRRYKPNLLLTHPSYVDNQRHATGVFSDKVEQAIAETDRWIGMLLDAIRDAGIEEETDVIVLSDHGQIDISRIISPNFYLKEAGYIRVDEEGCITSYDAYVKSTGASAQVHFSHGATAESRAGVEGLLREMAATGSYGFERVFGKEELIERYGLFGDFDLVLETDGISSFGEHTEAPAERGFDILDYRYGRGTHGYMPERGAQPTFIACGPDFKAGVRIPEGSILNHAPTIARALGVRLRDAEGQAVEEIFR
ncbi:MAG: alkaline phosphatase family protein [Clostridia bacterium]|nr:alkaline phosphatase family protein [Clostridia bacterium]